MIARTTVGALAATRLVRAWDYEVIGKVPKAKALAWLAEPVVHDGELDIGATFRRDWVRQLLDCPHCLGTWLSVGCVLGLRFRFSRPVVEGLAAAMVLSVIVQWMPGFSFEEPEVKATHIVIEDATS